MTVDEEMAARTYQYKHGDRPLDGYTIQRAAGRGGFGEVYYALSDGGREVALKLVLTWQQIELRGISQCMNVKSPQLVTIFDVKYGTDGRPWVIMEYVNGPSLRDLIDASPTGLGTAKAAFFLREIGKGLTYLHDCGIVHRDLKPGNIFFENGCVKIGDYGLSKAMSMSQHSGQTVAVGTLHYMAPEIGEGRYDRTIDIYALGALLFEMLTGKVPFHGSSVAEVLMKHLNSEVSPEGIEEPFQTVIRKSMAKNPADRYQSVQEMVEAVYGSDSVRNGVSQFIPNSLSQITGPALAAAAASSADHSVGPLDALDEKIAAINERVRARVQRATDKAARRVERAQKKIARKYKFDWPPVEKPAAQPGPIQPDPLSRSVRMLLAFIAVTLAAFSIFVFESGNFAGFNATFTCFAIPGAVCGVTFAWRLIGTSLRTESKWVQRLALGTPAAFGAALLTFPWWARLIHNNHSGFGDSIPACFATFLLMDWELRLSPTRRDRLHVGMLISSGICAFAIAAMMNCRDPFTAVAPVAGASAAVSLLSRWTKRTRLTAPAPQFPLPAPLPPLPPQPWTNPSAAQSGVGKSRVESAAIPQPGKTGQRQRKSNWTGGRAIIFAFIGYIIVCSIPGNQMPHKLMLLGGAIMLCFAVFKIGNRSQPAVTGPASTASSFGDFAAGVARFTFSTTASLLLMIAAFTALAVTMNLPGLLASGAIDSKMPHDLTQMFGTSDWPRLMNQGATAIGLVCATLCMVFLILARRHAGGLHILRGVTGVLIFLGALVVLGHSLPDLGEIPANQKLADVVDHYVQQVPLLVGVKACCEFLLSALLMGWPVGRARAVSIPGAKGEPTV